MKSQITVADVTAGQVGCLSQALDRAIFLTSPCINHGEISDQRRALDRVFANRCQLDCAFAFANRILFIAKYGINHTKGTKSSRIVWLIMYFFGELLSRAAKGGASSRLITTQASGKTLA